MTCLRNGRLRLLFFEVAGIDPSFPDQHECMAVSSVLVGVALAVSFVAGCSTNREKAESADAGGVSDASGAAGAAVEASRGQGGGAGGTAGTGGVQAAGGVAGAGGAPAETGSGGAPPHVVGNCQGLGAVDAWEKVTPSGVDLATGLGILSVVVDPIHAGTLYVGTDKQGLRKSTDCGGTWAKANTGKGADVLDSGSLWTLAIDPVDPDVLYAGSLYGSDNSLLKTTNGGADWVSLFPPGSDVANTVEYTFFQGIGLDVTDHRHLVVTFHAQCKGAYAPMCLAESKDAGATWRLFKGPLQGWGERAGVIVFGPETYLFHTWADGSYVTTDGGATWKKFGNGNDFQMYRARDGYFYLGTFNWGMTRSKNGVDWTDIPDSPSADALAGDGHRLFAATGSDTTPTFYTASEDDPMQWTKVLTPAFAHRLSSFNVDVDHHVLYSSNTTDGLFRMVTY
jgi:hypothetical protein